MSSDNVIKIDSVTGLDQFLTPSVLALRWVSHVGTLANMRSAGVGPRFVRIGTNVRYRLSDIEEYERKNTIDPDAA